ncbi:YihY/virulence factor BrkB family protein [Chthonobacter albigriseus]|uniref:YihY/virulence factor BrkB family protein n=1 Tax=Chthonobacter albigriseus TaxID=1683161 RepID=UPI0015EECEA6|nr:YihY/virulence factor BrkB family protein [Chthonobacter albigriseus]
MKRLRRSIATLWYAIDQFNRTDGWAIASHVALTSLMAMFPFLIFLTAVAAFFDLTDLSNTVVELIFNAVPATIAGPIAREVKSVLLIPRGDLLTIGVALAIWFASSGVEALRVGLNRAYGCTENRSTILLRLESMLFVVVGTIVLLTLAFLVVLMPVIWSTAANYAPLLHEFERSFDVVRYSVTLTILGGALLIAHLWLPSGHRQLKDVLPGVGLTLSAWLLGAIGFATYLSNFANYASTYAGLAGVMTALVFLYLIAAILLFGASLNAARIEMRAKRAMAEQMTDAADAPGEVVHGLPPTGLGFVDRWLNAPVRRRRPPADGLPVIPGDNG